MDDHDDQQLVDFLWTHVKVRTGNSGRIFCGKQESGSKNSLGQSTQILPDTHCILAKKKNEKPGAIKKVPQRLVVIVPWTVHRGSKTFQKKTRQLSRES